MTSPNFPSPHKNDSDSMLLRRLLLELLYGLLATVFCSFRSACGTFSMNYADYCCFFTSKDFGISITRSDDGDIMVAKFLAGPICSLAILISHLVDFDKHCSTIVFFFVRPVNEDKNYIKNSNMTNKFSLRY